MCLLKLEGYFASTTTSSVDGENDFIGGRGDEDASPS